MSAFTDRHFLTTDQYRDASNLDARETLHRRFSTNPYGWFNWIFDTLETLPNPARVLELGCGPAYMWKDCVERIPAGWNITLSDLSEGMLDAAWRSLNTSFSKWFVRPQFGGRVFLRLVFWLEERFPRFFGENGQYPIVVIKKS